MSHPREVGGNRAFTRRQLLQWAAGGAALAGAGGLLSSCTSAAADSVSIPLARPDRPVLWPLFDDNKTVASGLEPEYGATLQIYNWSAYINPATVSNFCKKYRCHAQVTTFNTMSEALAKLQGGQVAFDVFFPTLDVIGPLVEGKLLAPLNHTYIPNIAQAWRQFADPFYDREWRYTVPYTIYTTGMAWRKDLVDENPYKLANPWAMPWNAKYRGRVGILDDYREGICLALLKLGIYDLNTTSEAQITAALHQLEDLQSLVNVVIDNNDYTEVPSGQTWIHHAWSGDMAASWQYLPKGVSEKVLGYWFPPDGRGPVTNDTVAVLSSAKSPVLAHLFANYLLDESVALENIGWNGYAQPINGISAQRLIKEKIIPANLASTTVLPSYFDHGIKELELPERANQTWELAWTKFGGGL